MSNYGDDISDWVKVGGAYYLADEVPSGDELGVGFTRTKEEIDTWCKSVGIPDEPPF